MKVTLNYTTPSRDCGRRGSGQAPVACVLRWPKSSEVEMNGVGMRTCGRRLRSGRNLVHRGRILLVDAVLTVAEGAQRLVDLQPGPHDATQRTMRREAVCWAERHDLVEMA